MARQSRSSTGPRSDGTSIAASAGTGVLAAAIGYLVTYALIGREVADAFGENVADWTAVAWYFYNAHLVDVEASGSFGGLGGTSTVDFIAESGSANAEVLYLVPPLVLALVGAILAYQWEIRDVGSAVAAGAPVTIGYAVVMGLGAVVAEESSEGAFFGIEASGSVAPQFTHAIVLGGILYPLVFATAGAVLVALLRSR